MELYFYYIIFYMVIMMMFQLCTDEILINRLIKINNKVFCAKTYFYHRS